MADSNVTKHILAQTMKELMSRQPFSKISVGDICQACGMNRKSFYYHFRDKYDLVNWIFYTEFIDSICPGTYQNGWKFLEDVCSYFYSERAFYRNALRIEGQNSFREYFHEVMTPFMKTFSIDILQKPMATKFCIDFFSDAFLMAIIRWLTEEDQYTDQEFIRLCRAVMVALAKQIIADIQPTEEAYDPQQQSVQ